MISQVSLRLERMVAWFLRRRTLPRFCNHLEAWSLMGASRAASLRARATPDAAGSHDLCRLVSLGHLSVSALELLMWASHSA